MSFCLKSLSSCHSLYSLYSSLVVLYDWMLKNNHHKHVNRIMIWSKQRLWCSLEMRCDFSNIPWEGRTRADSRSGNCFRLKRLKSPNMTRINLNSGPLADPQLHSPAQLFKQKRFDARNIEGMKSQISFSEVISRYRRDFIHVIDWKVSIRDYLQQEQIVMDNFPVNSSFYQSKDVMTSSHHSGFCHGAEAVDEYIARDVHRRTCRRQIRITWC